MGVGIVIDGVVVQGGHGVIEGGHTIIERNGRLCSCSQKGCLEMYTSASALVRQARERSSGTTSLIATRTEIDAKWVFECAQQGDTLANTLIQEVCAVCDSCSVC